MLTLSTIPARRPASSDLRRRRLVALQRERRRRLAAIPRYDRYIAEAAGNLTLQGFWRDLKRQDLEDAQRLKIRLEREAGEGRR